MPKHPWLISLLACTGLWGTPLPARGQAFLPYLPSLDGEKLEQIGLELADNAIQLVRFQQYEAALSQAKLASQLAPNSYQTWFILGTLYLQVEKVDQGIDSLNRSLTLASDKESPSIFFTLGNAYFQKGDYETAISKLEAGLKLKPDVPAAFFDLGNSHLKLGQFSQAVSAYERAISLEKNFWPAINNIGLVKYEQGNMNGAIENWQKAIAIDAQQAEPRLAVAVALFARGKKEEALKLGESALAIDSRYGQLKFLEENLWGERLLKDTKTFLNTPQMEALLNRLEGQQSE